MGETLPFMLPRFDIGLPTQVTKLARPVSHYLRENVSYTFGGFNWTPAFLDLLLQVGVDRIMFSTDYPFASMAAARLPRSAAGEPRRQGADRPRERGASPAALRCRERRLLRMRNTFIRIIDAIELATGLRGGTDHP